MAGIGFTLRRLLGSDGLSGPLQAFAYATVISSGPWLTSSLALAMLGTWSALTPGGQATDVFLAIVSYCFAFSLVGVGVCQMVASRYLADRLYEDRPDTFAPAFAQLLMPLLGAQLVVSATFAACVPLPLLVKVAAVTLYLALNGTWLAMVFLSAAHDFKAIAWAFAIGWGLSLALGLSGSHTAGLEGQITGFAAGAAFTFFALLARLDREFGVPRRSAPELGAYFGRYWPLVVTGVAYNLGIWIDKIVFWYTDGPGHAVAGPLRAAPVYDNAMFLAYMTIIPALALFLLKVETDFYDEYRAYFSAIAAREGLGVLLAVKARMAAVLRESLGLLVKLQGTLTLAIVLLAPEITAALKISWLSLFVFRVGVIGAFLHVLHLTVMILLLYFDFRKEAAALAVVFLASNWLFSILSVTQAGLAAYGFGYAVASAVTLLFGLALLEANLRDLEYHVFMKQPL
ncbi:MAG: exopolysaccharide Pel transporter PelG [Candidatus Sericytochromatia bacterium]